MQYIQDNSMSQLINYTLEAANSNYAPGSEKDIFDSFISSPVFHNTSRNSASNPGSLDWNMISCLEETDCRALEQAENEGMI